MIVSVPSGARIRPIPIARGKINIDNDDDDHHHHHHMLELLKRYVSSSPTPSAKPDAGDRSGTVYEVTLHDLHQLKFTLCYHHHSNPVCFRAICHVRNRAIKGGTTWSFPPCHWLLLCDALALFRVPRTIVSTRNRRVRSSAL